METMIDDTVNLVKTLTDEKLREAYNYLLYLSDKDEWDATMELYHQPIMNEIQQGINEIKSGNFVKFEDIRKDV